MDFGINSFLEKFKKIVFREEFLYKTISLVVSEKISHPVDPQNIKLKNNIIFIEASPIVRNEVLIHQREILEELKKSLPSRNFSQIK